jgi:phosphoribosylformimino-5-aminoimidazole carboxamide ribotide isomerase
VLAIAAAVGVPVEAGGGVRSEADIEDLLDGGVRRVILGTAALEDPGLARRAAARFAGRVALGLDYRLGADGRAEVAVRGWEEGSGRTVPEVLEEVGEAELAAVIVTAIERDGMLSGPDLDGLRAVLQATELPVIASGGVGSVADVEALAGLVVRADGPDQTGGRGERRLSGVITGRALVDGRMTVAEGVQACGRFV